MDNFRDYLDDPQLVLQHLPPALQTAASYVPYILRWLINYLVSPIIYHFQSLGYQLTRLARTPPSELQTQDLLFPLLSLVLIYLAVTSALRTARYAFHMSTWLLKWGTIIGLIAVAWAWYAGDTDTSAPTSGRGRTRGAGGGWGKGPSLVDQAWKFVNGEQQREWFATDEAMAWASWVPEWLAGGTGARAAQWVEVVEGLGADNVRRAAEEWWEGQVNLKPGGKGRAKERKERRGKGKKGDAKPREGKNSQVR
ncbi:hypothetical protein CALCODRAFT_484181 [Calocera cornea HHB12733]|uniref:Uncharacterized protein n=1 Tax=Calocera cornea HHB12733 TaxID=1353952 RepID=A0A165F4B4_9BASI|nr:hypothetical protein CALCODRAFT_484181 [Calocera cornea HHB12733]